MRARPGVRELPPETGWKVLAYLANHEATSSQLGEVFKLDGERLGAFLDSQAAAGLLVERLPKRSAKGSEALYSIPAQGGMTSLPSRNYQLLSESLITGLVGSLGMGSARVVLRDVGIRTGESVGNSLLMKGDFARDPKTYAEQYVEGALAEMGARPKVLGVGEGSVEYEQFNCPFTELAEKFPALICDVLDEAVHEGIDKRSGLKTSRLSCIGHGEPSCRFRTVWSGTTSKAVRRASPAR